jgi:hypothetical protein
MMLKKRTLLVIVIIVVAILVFFWPKSAGVGSCGFCRAGEEYKFTEHNCFGFRYVSSHCENPIAELIGMGQTCTDFPGELLCYGVVYDYSDRTGGVKCYNSSVEPRAEVACNLMK